MTANHPPTHKNSHRAKYQEKDKAVTKFGFVFSEDRVDWRTEIPELPLKPRTRPDDKVHSKKVSEVEAKLNILKDERKKKKEQYKKANVNVDEQIHALKKNVDLGAKCLIVLNHDLDGIRASLEEIEEKIQKKIRLLKNLQRPKDNKTKKDHEKMNFEELEAEEERLSNRVTT